MHSWIVAVAEKGVAWGIMTYRLNFEYSEATSSLIHGAVKGFQELAAEQTGRM